MLVEPTQTSKTRCEDEVVTLQREIESLKILHQDEKDDVERHKAGWDREMVDLRRAILRCEHRCDEVESEKERIEQKALDYRIALHKGVVAAAGYKDQIQKFEQRILELSDEVIEHRRANALLRVKHASELQGCEQRLLEAESDVHSHDPVCACKTVIEKMEMRADELQHHVEIAENEKHVAQRKLEDLIQEIEELHCRNTELEEEVLAMTEMRRKSSNYAAALQTQSVLARRIKANLVNWEAERLSLLNTRSPRSARTAPILGSPFQSPPHIRLLSTVRNCSPLTPPHDTSSDEYQSRPIDQSASGGRGSSSITPTTKLGSATDENMSSGGSQPGNSMSLYDECDELAGVSEPYEEDDMLNIVPGVISPAMKAGRSISHLSSSTSNFCGSPTRPPHGAQESLPNHGSAANKASQRTQHYHATTEQSTQTLIRAQVSRATQTTESRREPFEQENPFVTKMKDSSKIRNADRAQDTVTWLLTPGSASNVSTSSHGSDYHATSTGQETASLLLTPATAKTMSASTPNSSYHSPSSDGETASLLSTSENAKNESASRYDWCHHCASTTTMSRRRPPPPRLKLPLAYKGFARPVQVRNRIRPIEGSMPKKEQPSRLLTPSNLVDELRHHVKGFTASTDGSSWVMDLPSSQMASPAFQSQNMTTLLATGAERTVSVHDGHTILKDEEELGRPDAPSPSEPAGGSQVEHLTTKITDQQVENGAALSNVEPTVRAGSGAHLDVRGHIELPGQDTSATVDDLSDQPDLGTVLMEPQPTTEEPVAHSDPPVLEQKKRFFLAALSGETDRPMGTIERDFAYFGSTWSEIPLGQTTVQSLSSDTWEDGYENTLEPNRNGECTDEWVFSTAVMNGQALPSETLVGESSPSSTASIRKHPQGQAASKIIVTVASEELRLMRFMLWTTFLICLIIFAVTSLMFILTYEHRQAWFDANHSEYRADLIYYHHHTSPRHPWMDQVLYWVMEKCGLADEVFGIPAVNA